MKYICEVCDWVYDEDEGYPEGGIAPGTKWENVPEDFLCPPLLRRQGPIRSLGKVVLTFQRRRVTMAVKYGKKT